MSSRKHRVVGTVLSTGGENAAVVGAVMPEAMVVAGGGQIPEGESARPQDGSTIFGVQGASVPEEVVSPEALFAAVKSNAAHGRIDSLLKKLREKSADRSAAAAWDESGHTLTHWAAKRGEETLLAVFLELGAPVDEASKDEVGMRPLHWACTEGRLGCIRLLTNRGADVDARDLQGCTPLIIASQWGQAEAAAYLVKIGANLQLLDKNDDSALHWASYKGNLELVGLLHHFGLPVDEPDAYGQTPLHLAALCGNQSVCEYLLIDVSKPARLEPVDKNGKTPRELAFDRKQRRVADFLTAQRPLCRQSPCHFVKHKLTLKAYIYWLLGEANPEAIRWPLMIMIFNKLLAHFFYFVYFLGLYDAGGEEETLQGEIRAHTAVHPAQVGSRRSVVDVPAALHAVNLITQLAAWATFLGAWTSDPGTLDARSFDGLRRAYDRYFDRLVDGRPMVSIHKPGLPPPVSTVNLCHSCHIQRPLRAKHCRVRRACVMAFDHYCPYVGNTVGLYNYRFFYLYCAAFTLSALEWQYIAVIYQRHRGRDLLLIATQVWFLPFILFGLAMVTYHTQLIYANLTTNEHMNVHRYEYLHDPANPLKIKNPYDRGCCHNLIDRFFPAPLHRHPLLRQITDYADDDDPSRL